MNNLCETKQFFLLTQNYLKGLHFIAFLSVISSSSVFPTNHVADVYFFAIIQAFISIQFVLSSVNCDLQNNYRLTQRTYLFQLRGIVEELITVLCQVQVYVMLSEDIKPQIKKSRGSWEFIYTNPPKSTIGNQFYSPLLLVYVQLIDLILCITITLTHSTAS